MPKKKVTKKRTTKKVVKKKAPAKKYITLPTESTYKAMDINDHITLFYGPPGVGKTTFVKALAEDDILFISTDRGTRSLKAKCWEVNSYEDVLDVLDALERPGAPKYGMICIDHVDDFSTMAEDSVLEEFKIQSLGDQKWGGGWKALKKRIHSVIQRLKALESGIVFICHEELKTMQIHGLDRDVIRPGLNKTAWNVIIPLTDLVGYCGFKDLKVAGKRKEMRVIFTQPTQSVYAKDRTRRTKPEKDYEILDGAKFRSSFDMSEKPRRKPNGTKKKVIKKRSRRR